MRGSLNNKTLKNTLEKAYKNKANTLFLFLSKKSLYFINGILDTER
jgi:hypothetical protein